MNLHPTPKRGQKKPAKRVLPLRESWEHSPSSYRKKGPGRKHLQGKDHRYIAREVERSAFHPEVIAERHAALAQRALP